MLNGTNRNGTNNGVHKDAAIAGEHELLWDGLAPAVTNALEPAAEPELGLPAQGSRGGAPTRTSRGTPQSTRPTGSSDSAAGATRWSATLPCGGSRPSIPGPERSSASTPTAAPVRVTVPGSPPRTDVGFHTVVDETGEGHETAVQGRGHRRPQARTAQLRRQVRQRPLRRPAPGRRLAPPGARALRRPKEVPGNRKGETHVPTLRKRLVALGVEQGFDEDQVRAAVVDRMGKSLDDLTMAELAPLIEGATRKLQQMREVEAA